MAKACQDKRMQLLILSFLMWAGIDVQNAMIGKWVGVLEYRDYKEPAGSLKRVKLPTWLTVEASGEDVRLLYVYDDGPGKTVTETATMQLKGVEERGTLVLAGKGEENNVEVQVRTTLHVGRNILEITKETAAAGQPFAFRHSYTMVRVAAPKS
jgi:hypothetical protein